MGFDPKTGKMKPEGGLWVANLEIASDHAMIPFGAGERKQVRGRPVRAPRGARRSRSSCCCAASSLISRCPTGAGEPREARPRQPGQESIGTVGMVSAATIHTATGFFCRVKERFPGRTDLPPRQDPNLQAPEPEGPALGEPALVP